MNNFDLAIHLFMQLVIIAIACRLVGFSVRLIGQPQVVGEMIAGVFLGPSVLGLLMGSEHAVLFPKHLLASTGRVPHPSMTVLYCLAQIGLVLYMFIVGLQFHTSILKKISKQAIAVSSSGILFPFALGALLAVAFANDDRLWPPAVSLGQKILFTGAAMSITAFPMLARIIVEQKLVGTAMGTLALASGAVDDMLAWCILAVVLASFKNEPSIALLTIVGGMVYGVVVLTLGRKVLEKFERSTGRNQELANLRFPTILVLLMLAAYITDTLGIYAVFGAFILGIAVPRGALSDELVQKCEPLTVNFFLPIFFVYSGLNTRIDLVNSWELWGITGIVVIAACLGKGVACYGAARLCGQSNREAWGVGALMNARGLMELIILNIGLEHGVISPTVFSIMVMMAIVTTLMATPLFKLTCGKMEFAVLDKIESQLPNLPLANRFAEPSRPAA